MTDFSKYEDMLYLKRPVSRNHPPMDLKDRAAQFSPFAALTGYGDAVKETARQTEQRRELDEYEKAALDEQLRGLEAQLQDLENGKNQAGSLSPALFQMNTKQEVLTARLLPQLKKSIMTGGESFCRMGHRKENVCCWMIS